jgi:hypothetical protein
MNFHVGQKVVCVSDDFVGKCGEIFPVVGGAYTIRCFDEPEPDGTTFIFLVEILNIADEYDDDDFGECSFATECFRPAVERKTDISIFTNMLKDVR